jgi:hypothetical protein
MASFCLRAAWSWASSVGGIACKSARVRPVLLLLPAGAAFPLRPAVGNT